MPQRPARRGCLVALALLCGGAPAADADACFNNCALPLLLTAPRHSHAPPGHSAAASLTLLRTRRRRRHPNYREARLRRRRVHRHQLVLRPEAHRREDRRRRPLAWPRRQRQHHAPAHTVRFSIEMAAFSGTFASSCFVVPPGPATIRPTCRSRCRRACTSDWTAP